MNFIIHELALSNAPLIEQMMKIVIVLMIFMLQLCLCLHILLLLLNKFMQNTVAGSTQNERGTQSAHPWFRATALKGFINVTRCRVNVALTAQVLLHSISVSRVPWSLSRASQALCRRGSAQLRNALRSPARALAGPPRSLSSAINSSQRPPRSLLSPYSKKQQTFQTTS